MAPTPTYNKDELFRLVEQHPDETHYEIARALTKWNYAHGRDVTVNVHTVSQAIHRYRDEMTERGILVGNRNPESALIKELKRNSGTRSFPADQSTANLVLRRLRQADRLARGLKMSDPREDAKARSWVAQRNALREVVDVSEDGVPYLRPAEPWELDAGGQLVSLICQPKPEP